MERLNFKMVSNNKEIINDNVAYYKKDNNINFKINEEIYIYDKKAKILTKKDKEKELVIKFKEKVIIITAKKEGIKFSYPMSKSSIKETSKLIILSYILDEEEPLHNSIFIEF